MSSKSKQNRYLQGPTIDISIDISTQGVCIEPRKVNIESPLICLISSPVFLVRRVADLVEGRGDRVVEPLASLLLLACNLLLRWSFTRRFAKIS